MPEYQCPGCKATFASEEVLREHRQGYHGYRPPETHNTFLLDVAAEYYRAVKQHAPLNSAHEAYAVILEELDEYKAEVWKKREQRDKHAMRAELVQLAAMCMRAVEDLGL